MRSDALATVLVLLASCTEGPTQDRTEDGMVWIPGGTFEMGSDTGLWPDEAPAHEVRINGFWMDATEVTNEDFARFVKETGYVTTAERKPDWHELSKQAPPGTPKPDDSLLVPGSLTFEPTGTLVSMSDPGAWWRWTPDANWRQPEGPGSNHRGRERHPVVQVSWDDATAFAAWADKRLPTEAEWEWAAIGGQNKASFPWGAEPLDEGSAKANTWQGVFPAKDLVEDGFGRTAPVATFPPNGYGLFDMAGNVWEWCRDWYRPDTYAERAGRLVANPEGPASSFDPQEPTTPKRVQRGGSFLCNSSYCAGYRVTARMKSSPDSSTVHTGFRCVRDEAGQR